MTFFHASLSGRMPIPVQVPAISNYLKRLAFRVRNDYICEKGLSQALTKQPVIRLTDVPLESAL